MEQEQVKTAPKEVVETKEEVEAKKAAKALQAMINNALPVKKAVFHQAVANGYMEPETNFSSDDVKIGRRVEMWLTPNLLICKHNGKFFATPHSNCVYFRF